MKPNKVGSKMDKYVISKKDMHKYYFHMTDAKNLANIEKNGLIPNIGHNARFIEKSKKVFFVEGLDNFIFLFDCWINCFYYIPIFNFIYKLGAFFLRQKWFPMFIADGYFGTLKKSKLQRKRAFKIFDKFLSDSIVLKLDLEENVDFSYDDQDEIKARGYQKRHLELMGYSKMYSSLEDNSMDRWNMHTFTNHGISPEKIKICYLPNNQTSLEDILNYAIGNTSIDIEKSCPILWDYLTSRKWEL